MEAVVIVEVAVLGSEIGKHEVEYDNLATRWYMMVQQRHLCGAAPGSLSLSFLWRRSLLSGTNARKNVDTGGTIKRNMLELLKEVF